MVRKGPTSPSAILEKIITEGGMKRVYQLLVKIASALSALTAGYFGKGKKGFDRF